MITIQHQYHNCCHSLKINFTEKDEVLDGLLIFYNEQGDEIKRLTLKGNSHIIDLSFYNQPLLYVKIETRHNTVMKRLLLYDTVN